MQAHAKEVTSLTEAVEEARRGEARAKEEMRLFKARRTDENDAQPPRPPSPAFSSLVMVISP